MKRDLHHRHHDHHDYDHYGHDYDHQQNDHQLMIIINCAQFWGGRVWENDDAYAILWGSRMLLVRMPIIMIR